MMIWARFPFVLIVLFALPTQAAEPLSLWLPEVRGRLLELVARHAGDKHAYAAFDADNTIWQYDLEESLMEYLQSRGQLSLAGLDSGLKWIPTRAGERLGSYYQRLCTEDENLCIPWIAKVFAGFSLGELRAHIRQMMAARPEQAYPVPRIYRAQVQLITWLREHGIRVYVVTAALEELARMLLSDPAYGIGLPPENVIGVKLMLKKADGSLDVGSHKPGHAGMDWRLSTILIAPGTWYAGKLAAILTCIDPVRRPILVAGDAPSDAFMLFHADVQHGGLRLFVRRKEAYWQETRKVMRERKKNDPNADQGWIDLRPAQLHPASD